MYRTLYGDYGGGFNVFINKNLQLYLIVLMWIDLDQGVSEAGEKMIEYLCSFNFHHFL